MNDTVDTRVLLHLEGGPDPGTWNVNTDGTWNEANNWDPVTVPDSATASANFMHKITAPRTITLDGDRNVAQLVFENSNSYTIAQGSGGTLSLGDATHNAVLNVNQGSHFITAPLALAGNTIVNIAAGSTLAPAADSRLGPARSPRSAARERWRFPGRSRMAPGAAGGQRGADQFEQQCGNAGQRVGRGIGESSDQHQQSGFEGGAQCGPGSGIDSRGSDYDGESVVRSEFVGGVGEFRSVRVYAGDVDTAKIALYGAIANANAPLAPSATDG